MVDRHVCRPGDKSIVESISQEKPIVAEKAY